MVVASTSLALLAILAWYVVWRTQTPAIVSNTATKAQFATIVDGQSQESVERLLGVPSGVVRDVLIPQAFEPSRCTSLRPAFAQYYYRPPDPTFVVYFDDRRNVICKEERYMAVHVR